MIINHNMSAINANRVLKFKHWDVSSSMERLASGMRINKAGDDASGLAVSEKMRTQIQGLRQAVDARRICHPSFQEQLGGRYHSSGSCGYMPGRCPLLWMQGRRTKGLDQRQRRLHGNAEDAGSMGLNQVRTCIWLRPRAS